MRVLYPDLHAVWPGLANPHESSYALAALTLLPNGLVGIMLAAMFSATMSEPLRAAERARRRSSRRDIYPTLFPPRAERAADADRRLDRDLRRGRDHDRAGHDAWPRRGQSVFEVMLTFNTVMSLAYGPPALLGLVVRRTPSLVGPRQLRGRPRPRAATAPSSPNWGLVHERADHRPRLGRDLLPDRASSDATTGPRGAARRALRAARHAGGRARAELGDVPDPTARGLPLPEPGHGRGGPAEPARSSASPGPGERATVVALRRSSPWSWPRLLSRVPRRDAPVAHAA